MVMPTLSAILVARKTQLLIATRSDPALNSDRFRIYTDSNVNITSVTHNTKYHRKVVLLSSLHLNGNTVWNVIHKQKDRTTLYSAQMKATEQYFPLVLFINDKHYHRKVLLSSFHLHGPNTHRLKTLERLLQHNKQ